MYHHFRELNHDGDDQDKSNRTKVFQFQGCQQVFIDQVTAHGGQGQHEGGGQRHTGGGFQFSGYTHEGAQAEELDQHEVVDQDGTDENKGVFSHSVLKILDQHARCNNTLLI